MKINFQVVEYIIYLEFALVLLMMLVACVLKVVFSIKQKRTQKLLVDTEDYLYRVLGNTAQLSTFPEKAKKMNLLLPIIKKFDDVVHTPDWKKLKTKIGEGILHKLAKKNSSHRKWHYRFLAAECFKVYAENQDQEFLVRLIKDKYPLVTLSASVTAVKLGTVELINVLIDRMAQERRLALTMFLMLFENANSDVYHIISDRLKKEKDPFTRASCYKILLKSPTPQKIENFQDDLQSNNLELKLSALRYLSSAQGESAIPTLVKMLKDKSWEVTSTAAQLLGDLKAVGAINEISSMLRNSEWWVRLNAALALKKLGNEGVDILKIQNPSIDKYAYEVAQHVLQCDEEETIKNG